MPEQYVAMRDEFERKGLSHKKAQAKAAAIYNSKHPDNPVGRHTESVTPYFDGLNEKQNIGGLGTLAKDIHHGLVDPDSVDYFTAKGNVKFAQSFLRAALNQPRDVTKWKNMAGAIAREKVLMGEKPPPKHTRELGRSAAHHARKALGINEDKLPGGADAKDLDAFLSRFESDEVAKGIKVEMEHTNDRETAKEIVSDHLDEDPHYYSKLAKVHEAVYPKKFASISDRFNARTNKTLAKVAKAEKPAIKGFLKITRLRNSGNSSSNPEDYSLKKEESMSKTPYFDSLHENDSHELEKLHQRLTGQSEGLKAWLDDVTRRLKDGQKKKSTPKKGKK